MNPKTTNALRWITVLPASLFAGFLSAFPLHWLLIFGSSNVLTLFGSSPDPAERFLTPLVFALTYVLVGFKIAPYHKFITSVIFALLSIIAAVALNVYVTIFQPHLRITFDYKVIAFPCGLLLGLLIAWQQSKGTSILKNTWLFSIKSYFSKENRLNKAIAFLGIGAFLLSIWSSATDSQGRTVAPIALLPISVIGGLLFIILSPIRLWKESKICSMLLPSSSAILFILLVIQSITESRYQSLITISVNIVKVVYFATYLLTLSMLFDKNKKENEEYSPNKESMLDMSDKRIERADKEVENIDPLTILFQEACDLYDSGEYEKAIDKFSSLMLINPPSTALYYCRGSAKHKLGDIKGAMEDYYKSIELNAINKSDAYHQLSLIRYEVLEDVEGALEDINKAITLKNNNASYFYTRSRISNTHDALKDLNKAIELDPNKADYYLHRSVRKKETEDYEGSIQDLTKCIELHKDDSLLSISELYSHRPRIKSFIKDIDGSLEDSNKAVAHDPTNKKAILDRGIIKFIMLNNEGAIDDFNWVIKLDPKNAEAFYYRGEAKQSLGLADEGAMDMSQAKTLGYKD